MRSAWCPALATDFSSALTIKATSNTVRLHLQEYLSILRQRRAFEHELYLRTMSAYTEDLEAPFRAGRRAQRIHEFDTRIAFAASLIDSVGNSSDEDATTILRQFYENIREGLRGAAVCCVTGSPHQLKAWEDYADAHRGVCFVFKDRIFFGNKKVSRSDILYTSDGRLHPLKWDARIPIEAFIRQSIIPTAMRKKCASFCLVILGRSQPGLPTSNA